MIKTIIRALYSAFISIFLISLVLVGWTCFAFIFQPTKSGEIINVVNDIYESQKSVIIDTIDLSKLLIKDTSERTSSESINLLTESELKPELEDKLLIDDLSSLEDNGDNPLGIVIQPALPEVSEKNFPEITIGSLDNENSEVSLDEKGIGVDMN